MVQSGKFDLDNPLRIASAMEFRDLGHRLVDLLAYHLHGSMDKAKVLDGGRLRQLAQDWTLAPGSVQGDPIALLRRCLEDSHNLRHPRYVGHQVTPTLPLAVLVQALTAYLNNGTAVQEMSPVGTPVERSLVRWMCDKAGFGADADGVLASGGSLGNLTALLAARAWAETLEPLAAGVVLVSADAHYCIARAARVMGLGPHGVAPVPVDEQRRMPATAAAAVLAEQRAAGRRPFALVASSCTTPTGAFDPLPDLADLCERENLWLHVDGAHGASFLLSPELRDRLAGVERARSLVWDAHKMLLMPSLCTGVLFADGRDGFRAFEQEASYLFTDEGGGDLAADDPRWWSLGLRTLECTRPTLALPLAFALALYGEEPFRLHVERCMELTALFADLIEVTPGFELATPPQANIACFRFVPDEDADPAAVDRVQERVRKQLVDSGRFYLSQTVIDARRYLRVVLINPATTVAELRQLLADVSDLGRQ